MLDHLLSAGEFEVDDAAAVRTLGVGRNDRPGGVGDGRGRERDRGDQGGDQQGNTDSG
jgi:hypothetical protein